MTISEALYEEQVKYFGTVPGKFRSPTYDELRTLPLLNAVIGETLRLHPPIHSIIREVVDEIVVPPTLSAPSKEGTFVIPKGYFVMSSPMFSQHDPAIWRDAETWDPYRWTEKNSFAAEIVVKDGTGETIDYGWGAISKGADSPYQPFGAGRHRCIGEQVSTSSRH